MLTLIKTLFADDAGAVTVDWVVLTAAVIGLGMIVLVPIALESENLSQVIGDSIGGLSVGYQSQAGS